MKLDAVLVAKLVLTPLRVAAVSLASRRWGPTVGGWLAGLPLTSGPVSVFLAVEQGAPFAARAAVGTLAGLAPFSVFCLTYAVMAGRRHWLPSIVASLAAYAAAVALLGRTHWLGAALGPTLAVAALSLWGASRLLPEPARVARAVTPPRWDLPLRMLVATGLVVALTVAAELLGARWSGMLSPFPTFPAVLAPFTHRHGDAAAAQTLLRAVLRGSFAIVAFALVVATLLSRWPHAPLVWTYAAATAAALAASALSRRPGALHARAV